MYSILKILVDFFTANAVCIIREFSDYTSSELRHLTTVSSYSSTYLSYFTNVGSNKHICLIIRINFKVPNQVLVQTPKGEVLQIRHLTS